MTKTVLITGAGSGFGRLTAFDLSRQGYRVIAGVQIWPQAWQLRQEIAAEGLENIEVIKLDLLDDIDRAHALRYDVDVLFNNAGVAHSGTLTDVPMSLLRANFETNVFSVMELTKGFIRQMIERGNGKIVFNSSDAGLQTPPFGGAYSATKYAIEAIAATLREELKPKGIAVATVQPGLYLTGFNDTALEASTYWYDPETALLPGWEPPFTLAGQEDPQGMVDVIVKVITGEIATYRNVYPPSMEHETREVQAAEWDLTV
ncbi:MULTISPECIES: SDR family oxidoreductase [Microbacterium]|uniref:SDR family oxidoreductase n=1 Tax=Microbacterium wangchenii TaxID=2541726 RepID=A0ABX5SRM6_9MICO|nr:MULTISPECIES: SDR family oxidoreductase [Microbacterium]MCK6068228.1 SDR family oxidoreductase [Microbacterium sp. EYE_512]QBR87515.1 SDR family oxidoreductase [Microbacterium wangchenii]TFV84420.1 SDR family oxidoreductase [Microbacterium sp. dk485]TXK15783.1 SDR family oxidoreductase [Microbacterium wangchenii]